MNRETFQKMLKPLSVLEQELKEVYPNNDPMTQMLNKIYTTDENGYLFFSNERMKEFRSASDYYNDLLHNPFYHPELRDRLRLLVHSRYERIPMHYDEFISMQYVYSGKFKIQFPNRSQELVIPQGSLILMNSNVVHSFVVEDENDIILAVQMEPTFFQKDLLYDLSGDNSIMDFLIKTITNQESNFNYLIADYNKDDRLRILFEDLFCECLEPSLCSIALVKSYIKTFLILLMRCCEDQPHHNEEDAWVLSLLHYIDTHYADCTLDELADVFGFSGKYLSSLIKKKTGSSFSALLMEARMNAICNYLRNTDLPIREIAEMCGYSNHNFFYKKFQEKYGMSPKEYRMK